MSKNIFPKTAYTQNEKISKQTHFDRHPEPVEGGRFHFRGNPKNKDVKYDKTNPFSSFSAEF